MQYPIRIELVHTMNIVILCGLASGCLTVPSEGQSSPLCRGLLRSVSMKQRK